MSLADEFKLQYGKPAYVIIKASSVPAGRGLISRSNLWANCLLFKEIGACGWEKAKLSANCAKSNILVINRHSIAVLVCKTSFRDWNVQGSIDLDCG